MALNLWAALGKPYGYRPPGTVQNSPFPQAPSPSPGGYPGPAPVNSGATPSGRNWPGMGIGGGGSFSDNSDRGGQGFPGGTGGGGQWTTAQEFQNAQYGPTPSNGGAGSFLPGWQDIGKMAVGQAAGYPGSGALAMATLMGKEAMNPGSVTARDKASAGFTLMGPMVGGLKGLADAYSKTQYAANHPYASYAFGGNGDPEAVKYADSSFRSGFNPQQSAALYDAIKAQKDLGGQGNIPNAISNWAKSAYGDGNIHIIEPDSGLPANGIDITPQTYIDNSGAGVSLGDSNDAGGGGFIGDTSGSYIDNSGAGVSVGSSDNQGIDWGLYRGGRVGAPRPGMANPPGPDDQMRPLQTGEGVLNRNAMSILGGEAFDMLNRGKMPKKLKK